MRPTPKRFFARSRPTVSPGDAIAQAGRTLEGLGFHRDGKSFLRGSILGAAFRFSPLNWKTRAFIKVRGDRLLIVFVTAPGDWADCLREDERYLQAETEYVADLAVAADPKPERPAYHLSRKLLQNVRAVAVVLAAIFPVVCGLFWAIASGLNQFGAFLLFALLAFALLALWIHLAAAVGGPATSTWLRTLRRWTHRTVYVGLDGHQALISCFETGTTRAIPLRTDSCQTISPKELITRIGPLVGQMTTGFAKVRVLFLHLTFVDEDSWGPDEVDAVRTLRDLVRPRELYLVGASANLGEEAASQTAGLLRAFRYADPAGRYRGTG